MRSNLLYRWKTDFLKLALSSKEAVDLEKFITVTDPKQVPIIREPFPHVVLENLFKPEIYAALCKQFNEVKSRGLSKETRNHGNTFHAFDMDYDGYVYTPRGTIDPRNPLSIFYSLTWNDFFSKLFGQFTTFETTFAFHHHPAGDRTGFVHHDYTDKSFSYTQRLPNGVICGNTEPKDHPARRIIAILFYLNNGPWHEGVGGETGIYAADKKTLIKKVPPVDNSLFAFQISPRSMHAFQANQAERNSFVQWFHIPPTLLE